MFSSCRQTLRLNNKTLTEMERNSWLIIGIAQNRFKGENASSCHRNGQWVLFIKKNEISQLIFLCSHELSLPKPIRACKLAWPTLGIKGTKGSHPSWNYTTSHTKSWYGKRESTSAEIWHGELCSFRCMKGDNGEAWGHLQLHSPGPRSRA